MAMMMNKEEWMLLCQLNQHYDRDISQENDTLENPEFDWTVTGRTMAPGLFSENLQNESLNAQMKQVKTPLLTTENCNNWTV